jgi:apolipoprotein N-acyltransferase
VPLLYAILRPEAVGGRQYLGRSAAAGYACGVLWYGLNCYWIYATMHIYGALPPVVSAGILILFSLILGLYFALFAWLVALSRQVTGRVLPALAVVPVLWVAVEYLAAHVTEVPWDQLGYSQVDNLLLTQLAPVTGVYGLSLVIAAVNALWMGAFLASTPRRQLRFAAGSLMLVCALQLGSYVTIEAAPREAKALLLQENLMVGYNLADDNNWVDLPNDPAWTRRTGQFLRLSENTCTSYLLGMPEPMPRVVHRFCPGGQPPATLVAWPEAPSPFRIADPRFGTLMADLTAGTGSTVVVGVPYFDRSGRAFNSGLVLRPDGSTLGRYDKIHLVPWGEYVPFKQFFSFAGNLTQNVASFTHGRERKVFTLPDGHRFSIFICYEAVFASEIRQFAKNGAEVFVNISDDGWYGDTSAPWQHLNMARMRAIENRRWILRDTNSGVTAAIDPLGRVTESVPRHELTALSADYGYRADVTFYSRYGDVFACACGILTLAWTGYCLALFFKSRQVPSHVERS